MIVLLGAAKKHPRIIRGAALQNFPPIEYQHTL